MFSSTSRDTFELLPFACMDEETLAVELSILAAISL